MIKDFNIIKTDIEDVKIITPFYREDDRGYFLKDFEKDIFQEWGVENDIYENFQSYSKHGVIRGLHFQTQNPQIKIVSTIVGKVHDIAVDLRKDSPTFGKYVDIILSDENHNRLWIPRGFAHGFEVISDFAIMSYKCIGKYENNCDTGIRYDDPDIGIEWEIGNPIISERDGQLMSFKDFKDNYGGL